MKRLTAEDKVRMVEMRERGCTVARIARHLGCSQGAVSWNLLKLAAEPPKGTRPWSGVRGPLVVTRGNHVVRRFTPEEDARLLALEAEGLGDTEIGRRLGRKSNSVRGRLMTLARRDELLEAS
jgi:transposase-like protein